jgi:thioredoxin 1
MEKLSEENPNVLIGKANVTLNEKTTSEFGIKSIPTVLFFKDGQLVDRTMGFQTQQELQEKINSFL